MGGFFLTNFKDKNFRAMLMLSPLFQKTRKYAGESGVIKIGDFGFVEEFGGPGVLKILGNFFLTLHPLLAVSLVVLVGWC